MPKLTSERTPDSGAFQVMDLAKTAARSAGKEVVDLSVGSSDLAPPPEALEAVKVQHNHPSEPIASEALYCITLYLLAQHGA